MSSTYSPSLRAELIGAGDQSGTWGSTTNNNFQYIFEAAIAGYQTVPIAPTSNNQVLTYTNGPTATATADQSVYAILKLNASAVSANFNLFAPPTSKTYVIWNNTSYAAAFYNSSVIGNTTPAGSAIGVLPGQKVIIFSDGTNFYSAQTGSTNDFLVGANLTVNGTTTFTGIPTGPTAAAGTNTTQLATTAFVLANNFPSGTRLTFNQAAAPTFWTQDTSDTANNRMMRVVNTAGGGVAGSSDPTIMNVVPYHTHGFTTGGMNSANPHNHSGGDSGHYHNLETDQNAAFYGQSTGGGGPYAGYSGGYAVELIQPYTRNGNANIYINNQDINHSHSGGTDGGSSQTNWTPRYVNLIICQKN